MKRKIRTAIILCGGRGTRLGNITKKIPKTLVKVQGKEILWYLIQFLKINNFNHLILPLGYKSNLIKNFLKKNNNFQIKIDTINTGSNTNIGRRLNIISNYVISDNFLLINGDTILNFNLKKIFETHTKKKNSTTFISGEIIYPFGTIGVENKKIKDFTRYLKYDALNVRKRNGYSAFNFIGASIINLKSFLKARKYFKDSKNFEADFYSKIIRKEKTGLIKPKGFWHAVDNIKDLKAASTNDIFPNKFYSIKKLKNKLIKYKI